MKHALILLEKVLPRLYIVWILAAAVLLFNSCYYDYGLSVEEYDVVATFFDTETNFGKFHSYAMPDSIIHLVEEGKEDDITREYDELILTQINDNMQALGYQKMENPTEDNKPDVVLLVAVTTMEHYQAYYNYYWWGWGWYPGWGIWYPWYPGGAVYNYSTGTVLIDMVDIENANIEEEKLPAIWVAAINGLLGDKSRNVRNRLITNIDQCFKQSPYLATGD